MDSTITVVGATTFLILEGLKLLRVKIDSKYFPVLSVLVSAVIAALYNGFTKGFNAAFIFNDFLEGVLAGMTASGGYDFIKTIGKKV
jgi:hypothetical protein